MPQDQTQTEETCKKPLPDGSTIQQNVSETRKEAYINQMLSPLMFGLGDLKTLASWTDKVGPGGRWAGRLGEPYGNYNYGATGRALGLPLGLLQWAAGVAETLEPITGATGSSDQGQGNPLTGPPWGDTPKGQGQIERGYNAGC